MALGGIGDRATFRLVLFMRPFAWSCSPHWLCTPPRPECLTSFPLHSPGDAASHTRPTCNPVDCIWPIGDCFHWSAERMWKYLTSRMLVQEADQFLEWRGGLAQKREVEEKARRMLEEVRVRGG